MVSGKVLRDAGEGAALVQDGDVVMFGGFGGAGFPFALRDALAQQPRRGLTTVANNTDFGALADAGSLSRVVCSFPTGPSAGSVVRGIENGEIELVLTPQGTLAEQLHAAGSGLGGFLTPTGIGTEFAERWDVVRVADVDYLLVTPLKGNVAFVKASVADEFGNLAYSKASRNFNPLMAMAADITVAEVDHLVPVGELAPEAVHTPGVFVDFVIHVNRGK